VKYGSSINSRQIWLFLHLSFFFFKLTKVDIFDSKFGLDISTFVDSKKVYKKNKYHKKKKGFYMCLVPANRGHLKNGPCNH